MIMKPTDNFLKINVMSPDTKLYMLLTTYMEKAY